MTDTKHTETPPSPIETEEQETAPTQNGYKEQLMRVSADFANYKRRTEKEREQWMSIARINVIEKFLPIVDDLDRSLSTQTDEHDTDEQHDARLQGIILIQKNMHKILQELEVEPIDCSGQFDPEFHEALLQVESAEHASGTIVAVLSPGYRYKDTVIRHAKVSVAQ